MNRVEMPRKRRREDEGNLQQKKEKKHQQQLRGVDEQNKPHSYLKRTAFDILKASKMGDKFGTLRGALKYYEVCEEIIKLGIANTDTERCCLDVTITVLFNLFESTYAERDKLIGELVKNKEERMELKAERQTIGLVPVYKGFSSIELFGLHSSIQTPPFEFAPARVATTLTVSKLPELIWSRIAVRQTTPLLTMDIVNILIPHLIETASRFVAVLVSKGVAAIISITARILSYTIRYKRIIIGTVTNIRRSMGS
jgi:hypothetical protein